MVASIRAATDKANDKDTMEGSKIISGSRHVAAEARLTKVLMARGHRSLAKYIGDKGLRPHGVTPTRVCKQVGLLALQAFVRRRLWSMGADIAHL